MRHSFGTLSHSIGFFQYWPSHCHLQSGLGIIVWHPGHMPLRDHTGVLLQHARSWYFSTSVCHSCSRYAHGSYSKSYIQGTTHSEGRVCWLPRLSSSSDCVQRRTRVSFLWDALILGWTSKPPCSGFAKGPRILNIMIDFCYPYLRDLLLTDRKSVV